MKKMTIMDNLSENMHNMVKRIEPTLRKESINRLANSLRIN